mgnify:FL=1
MNNLKNLIVKNKKYFLYFSVLLIFLYYLFSLLDSDNRQKTITLEKKSLQNVLVKKVNTSKFSKPLILRGHTKSSRTVTLKSQVEGKISSINYIKGESAKAGKEIVLINPEDKVAKSREMEALLSQRKKEYSVAEELFEKGFRSEVKLSESRTKFEEALALFDKSQVELNNTRIMIPFDSFIDESYVELGDYLKKGDEIVTIVDLDPIFLVGYASEKEVSLLNIGQKGLANLSNGQIIQGYINFISVSANEKTRNFKVQLEMSNKDKKVLAGISGEIELNLDPVDSFFIPSSVVTLNEKGELGIKIIEDKKVKFLSINILSDTGKGYWISDNGLSEIDLIIRGQEFVLEDELVIPSYEN